MIAKSLQGSMIGVWAGEDARYRRASGGKSKSL